MKQNQIKELERLDNENLENIFNVYEDVTGHYFYNLLQTIHFPQNLPSNLFKPYNVVYGDTWPYISYKNFNTPNLWWIILLANNMANPLAPLKPSTTLKIPILAIVKQVLSQIS